MQRRPEQKLNSERKEPKELSLNILYGGKTILFYSRHEVGGVQSTVFNCYLIYRPRNDRRQSRPRPNLKSEREIKGNKAKRFARSSTDSVCSLRCIPE